jgi:hypothetical protein
MGKRAEKIQRIKLVIKTLTGLYPDFNGEPQL